MRTRMALTAALALVWIAGAYGTESGFLRGYDIGFKHGREDGIDTFVEYFVECPADSVCCVHFLECGYGCRSLDGPELNACFEICSRERAYCDADVR